MSAAFDTALALTLGEEGGTSDNAADRGGLTARGVTQSAYDLWRIAHKLPDQPVTLITDAELRAFYFEGYWTPCACEQMPLALACEVFDMAVNSGPAAAVRTLQQALGCEVDGIAGPATLAAIAAQGAPLLPFLKGRKHFYVELVRADPTQLVFLDGWLNRLLDQAWNAWKGANNG